MPEIVTDISIAAPPDAVWAVLSDLPSWREWNPFIPSIRSDLAVGSRVRFRVTLGRVGLPIEAELVRFEPGRALAWVGPARKRLRGLAQGEHYFELQPEDGGTRFVHGERFEGPLFTLPWDRLEPAIRGRYVAMNDALKKRVEG